MTTRSPLTEFVYWVCFFGCGAEYYGKLPKALHLPLNILDITNVSYDFYRMLGEPRSMSNRQEEFMLWLLAFRIMYRLLAVSTLLKV